MRAGSASGFLDCYAATRHDQHCVNLETLESRLRSPLRPRAQYEGLYPSPPMSNPPSPPSTQEKETAVPTTTDQQSGSTTTDPVTSIRMPGVTAAAPSFGRPFYEPVSLPPLASAPPLPARAQPSAYAPLGSQLLQTTSSITSSPALAFETTRSTAPRGGRKSKAHVASACVNCKRAHLSCDVERPCARCVASGKQDSCFDVQHKKRGRPRLREEGDLKAEQMISDSMSSTVAVASGSSPRTIATPRHRRAESYRSLRSQGSDGSGVAQSPTYPFPPPPTATQPNFGFAPPSVPSQTGPRFEIPTAYLDMDLTFIKANASYRQIMLGGQEVSGQRLDEVAIAVDGESFQNIRNRLRSERTSRDPTYMPPINQPGQDPLQGALEADVDRYTEGFQDHTHTWSQRHRSPSASNFPARVRLAKANAYFVAITLPTFRPVEQIPAHVRPPLFASISQPAIVPASQSRTPESYRSPGRQLATQSAPPPTGYAPFPATQVFSAPQPSSLGLQMSPRTYPPPVYPLAPSPYQQQQQSFPPTHPNVQQLAPSGSASGTPRLPVAEPPTETTAFTPRTSSREPSMPQVSSAGLQLPPIITAPAPSHAAGQFLPTIAGPSSTQTTDTRSEQQDEPSEDSEGTPRKRRRMGIDDVLD